MFPPGFQCFRQALNKLNYLVATLFPDPVIINCITKVIYHFILQDVANLKGQISDCQVNVQMENKNSPDLNEIISNIRKQYERGVQKSREETEAWYQNKVSCIVILLSRPVFPKCWHFLSIHYALVDH